MLFCRKKYISALTILVCLVMVSGCRNQTDAPPVPGNNGVVQFDNVTHDSITVRWSRGKDENTNQSFLDYEVVYSKSDNISTVTDAEANGTQVPVVIGDPDSDDSTKIYWNQDITSINATDLDDGIIYYFTVLVRDRYWHKSVYATSSQKTVDITAPESGDAGALTITKEAITDGGTKVSLTLSWTKASDNNSSGPEALEYRVVRAKFNKLGSPLLSETNDISPDSEKTWRKDVDTLDIAGLDYGTLYYFNVIVKDEDGNEAVYQTISQLPTAGNDGALSITSEASTSMTLNWAKASDSGNDASLISYAVVYSTSNNIGSVDDAETNNEGPSIEWNQDITEKLVTGLTVGQNYYFNVIAKDYTGFKTVYTTLSNAPKTKDTITTSNVIPTSLTLSWTKAEDSGSDQSTLTYLVVQAEGNVNIGNVANAEANGTILNPYGDWIADISAFDVSGLDSDKNYQFNVLVQDSTGHKTAYGAVSASSTSREAKSLDLTRSFSMVETDFPEQETSSSLNEGSGSIQSDALNAATPSEIDSNMGNLALWLEGDDCPENSGDRIAFWKDKSGRGNDGVQAVSDLQPVLEEDCQSNGLRDLYFHAEKGEHLVVDFPKPDMPDSGLGYTIFVAGALPGCFLEAEDSGGASILSLAGGGEDLSGNTGFTIESKENFFNDLSAPSGPFVSCLTWDGDGANGELSVNGKSMPIDGKFGFPSRISKLTMGYSTYCNDSFESSSTDTTIAEVIVFESVLTLDQRAKVLNYLSDKWGISLAR